MAGMRRSTRSNYRTPSRVVRVPRSRGRSLGSRARSAIASAADTAATAASAIPNPYVRAMANGWRVGRGIYRAIKSRTTRRGYVKRTRSSAFAGGKVKDFKPVSRKMKVNGKLTKYALNTIGVHAKQELRCTTGDGPSKTECLYVGHASIPLRQTALNVWRATIKALMNKAKVYFQDFTQDAAAFGLSTTGTTITFNYFATGLANTLTALTFTGSTSYSFEEVAQYFANAFGAIPNIDGIRPYEMVLTPLQGIKVHYRLEGAKVHHLVKSAMKIQNRTISTIGENEADDVDNAPLSGRVFNVKGNNMLMKNSRRLLRGVGAGTSNLANSETFLLGQSYASGGETATDGVTFGQNDPIENQYARPSDIPNAYEIVNCQQVAPVTIQPGEIRTDVIKQNFQMTWEFLIKLLYGQTSIQKFNPNAGLCHVMVLNKMIGNSATSVTIAGEVQLDMWTAVTSKINSYTNPVIYQNEFSNQFIEA